MLGCEIVPKRNLINNSSIQVIQQTLNETINDGWVCLLCDNSAKSLWCLNISFGVTWTFKLYIVQAQLSGKTQRDINSLHAILTQKQSFYKVGALTGTSIPRPATSVATNTLYVLFLNPARLA